MRPQVARRPAPPTPPKPAHACPGACPHAAHEALRCAVEGCWCAAGPWPKGRKCTHRRSDGGEAHRAAQEVPA